MQCMFGLFFTAVLCIPLCQARIWSILLGFQYGGHEYFNADGYQTGFGVDLIDKVCSLGKMDCRVVIDVYSNCWKANPGSFSTPGEGLLSRRVDACLGWLVTVPRIHSLAFSKSYLKLPQTFFFTLKGQSNSFNVNDLAGKNIAFMNGASADAKCVSRQQDIANSLLSDDQVIIKPNKGPLLKALQDGEVDAVFGSENYWSKEQRELLDKVPKPFSCSLNGNALMARKDSDIIAAWNIGFSKLYERNGYAKFCEETVPKHAHKGTVMCLDM